MYGIEFPDVTDAELVTLVLQCELHGAEAGRICLQYFADRNCEDGDDEYNEPHPGAHM
jgi:hypothetical protein